MKPLEKTLAMLGEILPPERAQSADYDRLFAQAQEFASQSHSVNTQRSYAHAWRSFTAWCAVKQADHLRPIAREALVGLYIADIASKLKPASINSAVAGIRYNYHNLGLSLDTGHATIAAIMKGIRFKKGTRQTRKNPILVPDLRAMVTSLSAMAIGAERAIMARDRAILLLGFAGAFRRSELVSLRVEDLTLTPEGYRVLLRKSKTDQESLGHEKAIPFGTGITCPCVAIDAWLTLSGIKKGLLFRSITRHGKIGEFLSDRAVAEIIKRNPALQGRNKDFSGHSLRAGLCTSAAAARVPEHIIMAQSGHKSRDMLQRYIRQGVQFKDNAAGAVGL